MRKNSNYQDVTPKLIEDKKWTMKCPLLKVCITLIINS